MLAPLALGWYGFAARRLLAGHSALAVGLMLGGLRVATSLPALSSLPLAVFAVQSVTSLIGLSLCAIWLYERPRGSLWPVLLLEAASSAATIIVFSLAGTGLGTGRDVLEVFAAAQLVLAVCLVVGWRMWRGPTRELTTEIAGAGV